MLNGCSAVYSDFGFERSVTGSCELDLPQPPVYPPAFCPSGTSYNESKGYRKEAGNTCENGVDHSADVKLCPADDSDSSASGDGKGWIAAVVLVPLIVIALIVAIVALRVERFSCVELLC